MDWGFAMSGAIEAAVGEGESGCDASRPSDPRVMEWTNAAEDFRTVSLDLTGAG